MKLLKQVVGIDVSSESLSVSVGTIDQSQAIDIALRGTYKNSTAGFNQLASAVSKHRAALLEQHAISADELPLYFVMEASGVYYERLAVWLVEQGYQVSVVLPNKIKAHAKSDNRKSKTDRIDADAITHFGLEKGMKPWLPAEPIMAELKSLVREHESVTGDLVTVKNRLHALEKAARAPKHTIKRLRQQRDMFKKQLKQIEQEIKELIKSDPELAKEAECIDSAPAVGLITVATVLAETNRFEHVECAEQLVSYVGIDPTLQQSGKHKGTVRISRKGNRVLRHALYMPALCAIKHNPAMRALHQRIVARTGIKMKGVVAVMRKLLSLMYTLWKKRECYNPAYAPAPAA